MSKNILLLGRNGQLGWEARRCLSTLGNVTALDWPEIDFADLAGLRRMVLDSRADIIYNAVAYTAVDKAESEPEKVLAINGRAPGVLAECALVLKAALVHISTDYVFDGQKGSIYSETDEPHPLNLYGQSKLEGEQAVLQTGGPGIVLRTSWVYSTRADSFVGKVLSWAHKQTTLKVVQDQVGSPTWARLLAEASVQMLAQGLHDPYQFACDKAGLYHLAGGGAVSRLDWAREIIRLDPQAESQTCREVLPALTSEFPTPAARPLQTPLDCRKFRETFGLDLGDWQQGLKLALS